MKRMKQGQTWSIDAVVAVVIFILAAMLMFYLLGPAGNDRSAARLASEAEKLPGVLSASSNLSVIFVHGSKVDVTKLGEIINLTYSHLKSLLGMESDFCIYFEDEKGNLVPTTGGKVGIGSPLANISGKACNETY